MNNTIIIILFTFFAFSSCKIDPYPKDALKEDELIDILVDLHLAQSIYTERHRIDMDSIRSVDLHKAVIEKHQVEEDKLITTIEYYTRNPKEYSKVYEKVLSKVMKMEETKQFKGEVNIKNE